MNQPPVAIKVLNIDHLGIIAGIIDEMELVELVNKQIGIKKRNPNSRTSNESNDFEWIRIFERPFILI